MNIIAVDGSAASGKVGFGIYSHNIKISSPVKNRIVSGISYPTIFYDETQEQLATNNRGELLGMLYLFHYIETLPKGDYTVVCDSEYTIKTLQLWYPARIFKGTEGEIKNHDIIRLAYHKQLQLINDGWNIIYRHQKAHIAKRDIERLTGIEKITAEYNTAADLLAKEGYKYPKPTIIY